MNKITFEDIQGFDRLFRTPEKAGEEYSFEYDFNKENDKISSNNMAIMGMPGTGKTTLALHMAAAIQVKEEPHPSSVLYYSLEQPIEVQAQRLRKIDSSVCVIENVYSEEKPLIEEIKKSALLILREDCALNNPNYVFFPSLSPLPLIHHADEEGREHNIFWQRFEELKDTIKRIKKLAEKKMLPPLRMVVIDSLSMLADFSLSRYLVDQLFQLFAEEKVIGLFVLEANSEPNLENARALSTENANVTASADVVISLTWQEVDNYSFRQINFLKSRVSPNAYGNHLLKLSGSTGGCQVFPTLHAWHPMLIYFKKDKRIKLSESVKYREGIHAFLAKYCNFEGKPGAFHFDRSVFQHPESIREFPQILIYGPRHTQKMALAARYAAYLPDDLLANEHADKTPRFLMVSFGVSAIYSQPNDYYYIKTNGNGKEQKKLEKSLPSTKGKIREISSYRRGKAKAKEISHGYLLELHPGFILPEELMWYIDKTIEGLEKKKKDGKIIKIVKLLFVNISSWRVSYPMLYKFVEKGDDNFFSIVAQYIQWKEMSCLYVLSSDEKEKEGADAAASSDKLVSTLRSFAHLTIKVDYFDQRGEKDPYSPCPFSYWDNRIFRLTVTGHPVVGKVILHCPVSAFERDDGKGWDELHW